MGDPSAGLMVVGIGTSGGDDRREYRKGNWTVHETAVLIAAKKMDEERRMKGEEGERSRITELRWKWIENFCWKNGCMRSQNQCNDKWDNLLKDYKKVREYELRLVQGQGSYWHLEKHERKDRNLPSNLLPQIYEALVEVVEKRLTHTRMVENVGSNISRSDHIPPQVTPLLQQHHHSKAPLLPLPPPLLTHAQPLPALDTDGSEHSNSTAKRRKTRKGSSSSNGEHELGAAISKTASILAETLVACEEKKDRRHKELLCVEERRLQIEEANTGITSQGFNGLIGAINKLADAVFSSLPDKNPKVPKL